MDHLPTPSYTIHPRNILFLALLFFTVATSRHPCAVSMLSQRHRWWPNIETAQGRCVELLSKDKCRILHTCLFARSLACWLACLFDCCLLYCLLDRLACLFLHCLRIVRLLAGCWLTCMHSGLLASFLVGLLLAS